MKAANSVQKKIRASASSSLPGYSFPNKDILKESREMYRSLIDSALVGVYKTNLKGDILYANKALSKIFEFKSPKEMLSINVQRTYKNKKDRNVLIEKLKKTGNVINFEIEVITKKRKIKNILLSASLKDEVISGMMMDITEYKQTVEALRESEAKYSALVEQARDGVIIVQDGVCKFANKAIPEIFGYPTKEIVGAPYLEKVQAKYKDKIAQRYNLRMTGKKVPSVYEAKIQSKDGTIKDVEISTGIIQYQGRPAEMAIVRDTTERKKALEELDRVYKEAEDIKIKIMDLIDCAPNLAIQGYNMNGEIIFWNPASEKLYGFTRNQVKGKKLGELILSESDEKKFKRVIKNVFEKKKPTTLEEWTITTKKGEKRFVLSSIFPIALTGQETLAVGIDIDITEKKKAEERIREMNQQIEKFSEITADILSSENEEELFARISQAIVDISDFNRVLISYFKDEPPYREIIGHKGIKQADLKRERKIEMPQEKYLEYYKKSKKIGNQSYYIPPYLKPLHQDQDAVISGKKTYPKKKSLWHSEDKAFVFMKDVKGQLIGIISVNESKSALVPTDETVRPLEIFANLISEHIHRRILARKIKESEEKYQELLSNVKVGIFRITPKGKILAANPAGVEMFGFQDASRFLSLKGTGLYKNPKDREEYIKEMEKSGTVKNKELMLKKRDGTAFWANMTSTPIRNSTGKIMYYDTVIEDITERKRLEEDVKRLSITDELTGLYNRRYFNEHLPKEIKRAERWRSYLSFIMIDIDDFKKYNDIYHHLKGDEILKEIARVITKNIRKNSDWASRFGGEEFAIICPGVNAQEAAVCAERVRKHFYKLEFKPRRKTVHKTISLGVAQLHFPKSSVPRDLKNKKFQINPEKIATKLTSLADKSLFRAKKLGKNKTVISEVSIKL